MTFLRYKLVSPRLPKYLLANSKPLVWVNPYEELMLPLPLAMAPCLYLEVSTLQVILC